MELSVTLKRNGAFPVVIINGRLDAFGARKLDDTFNHAVSGDDAYAVLDMGNVSYLSSGGIRALLSAAKKLKSRNGELCLANVDDFCAKVLKIAGFDQMFPAFGDVAAAVRHCEEKSANVPHTEKIVEFTRNNVKFFVKHAAEGEAVLSVMGDISRVLNATIEEGDIKSRRFRAAEYSIGLGSLGGSMDDTISVLGEMMTIGGTMVWLPTDGNNTPDFLIPETDTGEVTISTGFNVALKGGFHEIFRVDKTGMPSMSLTDFYAAVFEFAKGRRPDFTGVISVAMLADIKSVFSSGVTTAPIMKNRPANRGMIMDKENVKKWIDINMTPKYEGQTIVTFGVGLDLTADSKKVGEKALNALFYTHPANIGEKKMLLHNHGVIFGQMPWKNVPDLDKEIKRITREGEFLDMRHLLDNTSVLRVVAGISYISDIIFEN